MVPSFKCLQPFGMLTWTPHSPSGNLNKNNTRPLGIATNVLICKHLEANMHNESIRASSGDCNQPQYYKLACGKQVAWPQCRAGQCCSPEAATALGPIWSEGQKASATESSPVWKEEACQAQTPLAVVPTSQKNLHSSYSGADIPSGACQQHGTS